jgi:hypothetical protein
MPVQMRIECEDGYCMIGHDLVTHTDRLKKSASDRNGHNRSLWGFSHSNGGIAPVSVLNADSIS